MDNRATVRKLVTLKARILPGQGQMVDGRTHDLSTGGLSVLLRAPIAPKSTVQVAIQLPSTPGKFEVVSGQAKVAFQVLRGDDYQVGLEWVALEGNGLVLLQTFLAQSKAR